MTCFLSIKVQYLAILQISILFINAVQVYQECTLKDAIDVLQRLPKKGFHLLFSGTKRPRIINLISNKYASTNNVKLLEAETVK